MDWLISFVTLVLMEIILGIDNIVFIAILGERVEQKIRKKTRNIGLLLALFMRILLLMSINWIMSLTKPLFTIFSYSISGRDLILIIGGMFLIWKSTNEIFHKMEDSKNSDEKTKTALSFKSAIIQIILLDLVFSIDSVITAVGMTNHINIMIAAVIVSMVFMLAASGPIASFIEAHPSLKVLALSFLIMIGTMLLAEGLGQHIPKGYIYFAMFFSLAVEVINIRMRQSIPKPK